MDTRAYKIKENKRGAVARSFSKKSIERKSEFQFSDNRPEAILQRKLKSKILNGPQEKQLQAIQEMVNNSYKAREAVQPSGVSQLKLVQKAGINSAKLIISPTGRNVAKTPNNFSTDRFKDAGNSIHQVSVDDIPGGGGTIVGGSESGARIDKQGSFDRGGKTWSNIQVQANRTDGGADYVDLQYPEGTAAGQKGTSIAEVHVDNRIVDSEKKDVRNRGTRLLKRGLMNSRGDRTTYPRKSYKITF